MPFDSGSQSLIFCQLPQDLPDDAVALFNQKRAGSLSTVLDEPQTGWVSGRHLLETRIDEETASMGGYLHLNLRTAVRKIPTALFKAECRIEELALIQANNSFAISRKQRKEIREAVTERLIKDMPPSLQGIPCVIDHNNSILILGTASQRQIDAFVAYFNDTLRFDPMPLYPEVLAEDVAKVDPDSLFPLQFTSDKDKLDTTPALGRDFVTWLWFFITERGGTFELDELGRFAVNIDGPLTFSCEKSSAMESVVRKGMPTISAEAKAALAVGKKLTRAKFILVREQEEWSFTLDADTLACRSTKLDRKSVV